MARRKPDTVKSATPGFQAILGRGELPAGTKTAGDLAREKSDATRYGYQPPLPSRPRPTAPTGKGGGGAQPGRTRAPSPGLPKRAPLPPRRPGAPQGEPPFRGLDRNIPSFPTLPAVPDVPDPMTTAGLRPGWQIGDAGFGGGGPNPLPIPAMANALPRPGISTPGTMPQPEPPMAGPPLGSAMAATLSNLPPIQGSSPTVPGMLDPNALRQLLRGM